MRGSHRVSDNIVAPGTQADPEAEGIVSIRRDIFQIEQQFSCGPSAPNPEGVIFPQPARWQVIHMDYPEANMPGRHDVQYEPGVVFGSVIHNDQFVIRIAKIQK